MSDCIETADYMKEFFESIRKYEGFYIARYEAGKENDEVVSKKEVSVYNMITRAKAIELSKEMYNSTEIKSELINSYAYDTTIAWISKNYENFAYETIQDELNYEKTGFYSKNNIYDLNFNVAEWTTENIQNFEVYRGAEFYNEARLLEAGAPRTRSYIKENSAYKNIGFRIIIFKID